MTQLSSIGSRCRIVQLLPHDSFHLLKELLDEIEKGLYLGRQNLLLVAQDIRRNLDAKNRIILIVVPHETHKQLNNFLSIRLKGFGGRRKGGESM